MYLQLVLHNQEFEMQMPVTLQEAVEQLLQRDPHERPTAQTFAMVRLVFSSVNTLTLTSDGVWPASYREPDLSSRDLSMPSTLIRAYFTF